MRFQQSTDLSDRPAPVSSGAIVFIDPSVDNSQSLVAAVQPETEIQILDPNQDALVQITQVLLGRKNISSLHLLSHGKSGAIQLGRNWLTQSTLQDNAAQIQQWSEALTEDADILLYGCSIAEGELGQAFLNTLSQITGADIAASEDLTGDRNLGGDWILEAATGEITSSLAFHPTALDRYSSILPSSNVVISQIYGGGGNVGASYRNDFIELFNHSPIAIDLSGWSVQYAAATGTSWQVTPLSGSIASYGYYLVQQSRGSGGTVDLPRPDAIGAIAIGAVEGKVALVNNSTRLNGTNPTGSSIVDFVGYGGANGFETRAASILSNTTAAKRNLSQADTDNNAADFTTGAPTPRNSSSPALSIAAGTSPIEHTLTNGAFTIALSRIPSVDLTVNFSIAGSANLNSDYSLMGGTGIRSVGIGSLVIAAGTTAATLTVQPIDDLQAEAVETIQLTLTNGTGYTIDSATASLTIAPNDFVVTNANDAGEGSLRQAILNANAIAGADTITFAGVFSDGDLSNDTILLSSGLVLSEAVTLAGGASSLTLQAVDRFSIFRVNPDVSATFDQFTFRNGSSGIENLGAISVSQSTFSGNHIGINNSGTIANLSNNTLSGNGTSVLNTGTIVNFVNNTIAGSSEGIANAGQIANLTNNLLASNGNNAIGSVISQSNNLVGTYASINLSSSLGSYGGQTQTHALLPGSVAIDAGISTNASTQDQRGVLRVGAIDIGAFESRGFTLTAVSGSNQNTQTNANFAAPLVVSINSGFNEPVNGGAITFSSPSAGASTNPVSQTIAIAEGQAIATVAANSTGGAYTVTAIASGNQGGVDFSLTNIAPNVAPTLTIAGTAIDYTENDPAMLIDAIATVSDFDSMNFEGGMLTIDYSTGGTADDRLSIRFDREIGRSNEVISWNGVSIGSFQGGNGTTPLIVRFNVNATPAAVSALLQNLTYANVSEDPVTTPRTLRLMLTDGDGGISTAAKTINVAAVNDAPVLVNHRFSITEGDSLTLADANLSAIDADSIDLSFRVSEVTNGQFEWISSSGVARTSFTQAQVTSGQVRFVHDGSEFAPSFNLSVSDGTNSTRPVAAVVRFTAVNDAPVNRVPIAQTTLANLPIVFSAATGNSIAIADADAGDNLVQVTLSATNGILSLSGTDGLAFTLGTGTNDSSLIFTGTIANINARLNQLLFTPTRNYTGSASLQIATSDQGFSGGSALQDADVVAITVNPASNTAPTISGIPATRVDEDTLYRFTPSVTDAEGDSLTFSIANLPSWATFNSATGTLSGTPIDREVGTTQNIRIRVSDANGAIADLPLFDLTVSNVNDAPIVETAIADQVAIVGSPLIWMLPPNTFADSDVGDRLTLSATLANGNPLPNWLSFDAATKQFSANPAKSDVGSIEIQVQATDAAAASVIDIFRLTVQPQPVSPQSVQPQPEPATSDPTGKMGNPTPAIAFNFGRTSKAKGTGESDFLKGSWFNDFLKGKAGNDVLSSGYGKARFGQDRLHGGAGNDRLYSGAGRDRLLGGAGNDRLNAGKGRDLLLGGAGNDRLNANQGDDILVGGRGHDTLVGGSGKDQFVFNAIDEAKDRIWQFEADKDVIDLRSIFKLPQFSATSSFEQYQKFVRLVQVGAHTEIQIDADGSNAGMQFVTLVRLQSVPIRTVNSTQFVL